MMSPALLLAIAGRAARRSRVARKTVSTVTHSRRPARPGGRSSSSATASSDSRRGRRSSFCCNWSSAGSRPSCSSSSRVGNCRCRRRHPASGRDAVLTILMLAAAGWLCPPHPAARAGDRRSQERCGRDREDSRAAAVAARLHRRDIRVRRGNPHRGYAIERLSTYGRRGWARHSRR